MSHKVYEKCIRSDIPQYYQLILLQADIWLVVVEVDLCFDNSNRLFPVAFNILCRVKALWNLGIVSSGPVYPSLHQETGKQWWGAAIIKASLLDGAT